MNMEPENNKEVCMKRLTWQATVLIGIGIICLSGIAIAFISHDDASRMHGRQFAAFGHMPPPPGMHEGFERGQGRGGDAFGPKHHQKNKRGNMRGERRGKNDLSSRAFERASGEGAADTQAQLPQVNVDIPPSPAAPGN
jgi:hypothetical protein